MNEAELLKEVFIKEAKEIIDKVESSMVLMEENGDAGLINEIFRYIHTLKSGSGIAGFTDAYEFTHSLENLLDKIRSGELMTGKKLIDLLLGSLDLVKAILFENAPQESILGTKKSLLAQIEEYMATCRPDSAGTALLEPISDKKDTSDRDIEENIGYNFFKVHAEFREDIFESGIDPLMIMEDLYSLGNVIEQKILREKFPELDNMDPERCYTGWNLILKTKTSIQDIDKVFMFVRDDNVIEIEDVTSRYIVKDAGKNFFEEKRVGEILVSQGILSGKELSNVLAAQDIENKKVGDLVVEKGYATENEVKFALKEQADIKKRIEKSTVRVDTGKLDNLLNLLGEIVIGQSSITRIADELDEEKGFRLKNALYGLDRITREFQEQIMSIRMIPIGPTFEQFRRFVRDAAHSRGKEIVLDIEGGSTELDKTVIERIDDPLKHMIRNAIDHGIEPAEEREAAGKNRIGRITLKAYHQEGNIFIEIIDDGMGINKTRIREIAEQKGLLRPGEEISDSRLYSFLFLPGFSTAEKVGDFSGRGVGMDVVKTNIESFRGSVEIETKAGIGTTFRIKLPLTLAIIEGMLVRVGNNIFIIPLLSIVESLQPREIDIKTVEKKGEVILVRNEYVSLVRLYEIFQMKPVYYNPWESLVVIVESGFSEVGLMIDELLGQQQIVIKSLETYITKSRAISGAAILGDGRVALILDIHGLIEEIGN